MTKTFSVLEVISTSEMSQACKIRYFNAVKPVASCQKKPGNKATPASLSLLRKSPEINTEGSRCMVLSRTVTMIDRALQCRAWQIHRLASSEYGVDLLFSIFFLKKYGVDLFFSTPSVKKRIILLFEICLRKK
jgi:hypothetical protein